MKYLFIFIFMFFSSQLYSQSCTVNAGVDLSICYGQSVTLSGNGNGVDFHWQSNLGLTDTNNLTPLATPVATTTYIFQSDFTTSINLIINGDFSLGNTGFISGYIYRNPPNYSVGEYWVALASDVPTWNSGLSSCGDHTSSNGKMMIVNGSTVSNTSVWCQTVSVMPNRKYEFSCWLETLTPLNPTQLQFLINGISFGSTLNATSTLCDWNQFNFIWDSGTDTSAGICIVNQNIIGPGNDFAIDDIGFSPLCRAYDSVTVTVHPVLYSDNPQVICNSQSYNFNSHIYTNPGIYYDTLSTFYGCDSIIITQLTVNPLFTSNNPQSICSGQTYSFNIHNYSTAGTYFDTLSTITGCDSIIVTLLSVNALPVISFAHPGDVCVDANEFALDYASPVGGNYSGIGVINNIFDPQKASAGIHQLSYSYTDPITNCSNIASENITIHSLPDIIFSISPETTILEFPKITFNDSTQGAIIWLWNFGDGSNSQFKNGFHEYADTGHYMISLTVIDNYGCKNISEEIVTVEREFKFYTPNSFTPNNDNINDLFFGQGVGISEYSMKIFNKWGQLIFESVDINNAWNGKYFPADTYVYKISLRDYSGTEHEYFGRIALMR